MHRWVLAVTLALGCGAKPAPAPPPSPSNDAPAEEIAPSSTLDADCYDRCVKYDSEDGDCTAYCTSSGTNEAEPAENPCVAACMETYDDLDGCFEGCEQ